jgi:iron complex outermembrane receptor protein
MTRMRAKSQGSYDRLDARGAVEGPLIAGSLYAQVAFSSKNRDGYQVRIPFPGIETNGGDDSYDDFLHTDYDTSTTAGGEDQQNIRGKLLWEANDDLEMMLVGAYAHTDEEAVPSSLLKYYDNGARCVLHALPTCASPRRWKSCRRY